MVRIELYLKIRDGKRDEYRKKHEDVPKALESAYLDSDIGLETYSIFEKDGRAFGYMEVKDPDAIYEVIGESDAQAERSEVMEPILKPAEEDIGIDEVYRMI